MSEKEGKGIPGPPTPTPSGRARRHGLSGAITLTFKSAPDVSKGGVILEVCNVLIKMILEQFLFRFLILSYPPGVPLGSCQVWW